MFTTPLYASTVLADSPIRYYRLNESGGTVALDLGSQAQNGTISATGVTYSQTTLLSSPDAAKSMLFDGATGDVGLPTTGLPTGANVWSQELWMKALVSGVAFQPVLFTGTNNTHQKSEIFLMDDLSINNDVFGDAVRSAARLVQVNVPSYVVYTYDGSNLRLYINGVQVTSGNFSALNLAYGSAFLCKGSGGGFTNCVLSDVAIYTTALSAGQIARHWRVGTN